MPNDALKEVILRNDFYRDKYRQVTIAVLLAFLLNCLLAGLVAYELTHRPLPEYFATTADGKIIQLKPLSDPVLNDAELLQWASQAAVAAYTYNYVNYRQELQGASEYFTTAGWKDYQEALKRSKTLETVIANKLVGFAQPTGAPSITDRGTIDGAYAWKVTMPILATFENVSRKITQPLMVTMIIVRVPILVNPKGVEISSFYAAERKVN